MSDFLKRYVRCPICGGTKIKRNPIDVVLDGQLFPRAEICPSAFHTQGYGPESEGESLFTGQEIKDAYDRTENEPSYESLLNDDVGDALTEIVLKAVHKDPSIASGRVEVVLGGAFLRGFCAGVEAQKVKSTETGG